MTVSRKRTTIAAVLGAAAVLAVASPLVAQKAEPAKPAAPAMTLGKRDPALVTAGTYQVDHEHTMVRWEVDHLGITPYFGTFGQITGSLTLDPKNPAAAKVDITIPIAKVTTASPGLTTHLLKAPAKPGDKPDFFGTAPADARFVSTAVTVDPAKPGEAVITGNLTLNGVTRPVTLEAEFYGAGKAPAEMGGEEMVGFEADANIKRSDFGISMGIPMVSDSVELDIVAAFVKK